MDDDQVENFNRIKEVERQIKHRVALSLSLAIITTSTLAAFYWSLSSRASDYNSTHDNGINDVDAYDSCGDLEDIADTKWTNAYRFNAILYTLLSVFLLLGCGGLVYMKVMAVVMSVVVCSCPIQVTAIIITMGRRLNPAG